MSLARSVHGCVRFGVLAIRPARRVDSERLGGETRRDSEERLGKTMREWQGRVLTVLGEGEVFVLQVCVCGVCVRVCVVDM